MTYGVGCDVRLLVLGPARITFSRDGSKASISGGEMRWRIICGGAAVIVVGTLHPSAGLIGRSEIILMAGGWSMPMVNAHEALGSGERALHSPPLDDARSPGVAGEAVYDAHAACRDGGAGVLCLRVPCRFRTPA